MTTKNNESEMDGIVFDDTTGDIIDNDTDGKLNDWLTSNDIQLSEIQVTIYRWDNPETGTDKTQVDFIRGDLPDKHKIGLKHGAGKYTIIIVKPKKADEKRVITSRTFKLGEHYNDLMNEERFKNNPYAGFPVNPMMIPLQNQNTGPNTMDIVKLMSGMMQQTFQMLTPILAAAIKPNENGGKADLSAYGMIDNILQTNAKNNIKFYGELQQKLIERDLEVIPDEKPGIIEQVLPIIDRFVPMLTGKNPAPEAENLLQGVKQTDEYKQITNNRETVDKLISLLDKKHGKTKVSKVLNKLNIQRTPKG